MKKKQIELTILSASLLTVMAGAAISPAVAGIANAFSNTPTEIIKLVISLPPLTVIPSALISSRLCDLFGKKRTLMAGLWAYLISGVGGGFVGTIYMLLVCRGLLGFSVGLIMPTSMALVSDYFQGDKAEKMMGFISASNHLGGMAAQLISGVLTVYCWRYAFGTYALACVAIFMVHAYLPESEKKKEQALVSKQKMPSIVYLHAISIFALMLVFYTIPVNLSLFIEKGGIGNAASSGMALAMVTGSALLMGIYFQQIHAVLKIFSVVIAIVTMATGFVTIYSASDILSVFLGVALVGFGEGYLLPLIFHSARTSVNVHQSVRAMAIITSMMYLGQFFSPLIIDGIGKQLPVISLRTPFFVAFCLSFGAAILVTLLIIITLRKQRS